MGQLLPTFFIMSQKVYQREQTLDYLVNHDELTGLKNRLRLSEDIAKSISELKKGDKLASLFFDLNLFKKMILMAMRWAI
jgi:GGDEF domain-containing protein